MVIPVGGIKLDYPSIVHWISKDARYRIIEIMLSTRSIRQLARELCVSPTAINKYLSRKTHPSDQVISRALSRLTEYERRRIYEVIIDDLINALGKLVAVVKDYGDKHVINYLKDRILEVIEELGYG